jgi:hypothetical protein
MSDFAVTLATLDGLQGRLADVKPATSDSATVISETYLLHSKAAVTNGCGDGEKLVHLAWMIIGSLIRASSLMLGSRVPFPSP